MESELPASKVSSELRTINSSLAIMKILETCTIKDKAKKEDHALKMGISSRFKLTPKHGKFPGGSKASRKLS